MKALVTDGEKSASVRDVPNPTAGEGEILVKVLCAAQNPTDWKAMNVAPSGRIVGCDFAGIVEDPNGSHWRKGQRVAGFVQGTTASPPRGVFAEYAVVEASLVYDIPESISYQQAAAIPLPFATAVQALFQRLGLPEPSKPAKSAFPVLINGGSSSVGKYAIQLCKQAGLFVVATASKRNHELLKQLGADVTIDYSDHNWPEEVRQITHDNLEHAFDCISEKGTPLAIAKSLSPTKGGHVVTLLPVRQERLVEESGNSKVKAESTIVYTVFERPMGSGYKAFNNCGDATPADKAMWEKYLAMLPDLLGSGKVKPNRIREMGGIDDIMTGFQEQREGKVSAEKLVYTIALS